MQNRKHPAILTICLILTFMISGNAHAKRQDMQKGRLTGQVIDESTQIPLVAVNIMLEDTPLGAATDMDGKFEIWNILPGVYNMRVEMMGYELG
ncbi:carboxypeptidase-like regulatory domain-containing protein [candidate division KSB1 bacterium]|nr:carboxypeptidase-like regulatory domain-containing protein [candidate division KSB1 bacterium]